VYLKLELKSKVGERLIAVKLDHRGYNYVSSAALNRGVDSSPEPVSDHVSVSFLFGKGWCKVLC
jgi:hypothetical protein